MATKQIESGEIRSTENSAPIGRVSANDGCIAKSMNTTSSRHLPHCNLYTRIKVSPNGVGVFAIREIPEGTRLFFCDIGGTVAIPVSEVETIADQEVRQMYIDFCPVINDCFVAPLDFNQITMGWYLNHSAEPNVAVSKDLEFIALKLIPRGEELVSDYTTYSDRAASYVGKWNDPSDRD